jgi:hypothetical protein
MFLDVVVDMQVPFSLSVIYQTLFVGQSCNRSQRSEGGRHSFSGKTMSEWIERFGGSSLCRGKIAPVPEL